MSNGNGLEPQYSSRDLWLSYLHWHNAANRWDGYMERYLDAQARGREDEQVVYEELMRDACAEGILYESIVNSYWNLWRN